VTEYVEPEQAIAATEHLGLQVRDQGLLFSALARPSASMFGEDAYPDLATKAAALLESLARNHPLFDGNKRFSWYLTLAFCALNEHRIAMPEDDAFELILGVAQGQIDLAESAASIAAHLVKR